jgi:hypothetical protein
VHVDASNEAFAAELGRAATTNVVTLFEARPAELDKSKAVAFGNDVVDVGL